MWLIKSVHIFTKINALIPYNMSGHNLQINSIDINKQIYKHGYNSNIQGISKQSLHC